MDNDLKNNMVVRYVKGEIIYALEHCKGYNYEVILCNLAEKLFDTEKDSGSYFGNDHEASEWIGTYFMDIKEAFDYAESAITQEFKNKILLRAFEKPDYFVMFLVTELADCILLQCKTIQDNYSPLEYTILTDDLIDKLIEEVIEV